MRISRNALAGDFLFRQARDRLDVIPLEDQPGRGRPVFRKNVRKRFDDYRSRSHSGQKSRPSHARGHARKNPVGESISEGCKSKRIDTTFALNFWVELGSERNQHRDNRFLRRQNLSTAKSSKNSACGWSRVRVVGESLNLAIVYWIWRVCDKEFSLRLEALAARQEPERPFNTFKRINGSARLSMERDNFQPLSSPNGNLDVLTILKHQYKLARAWR